MKVQLQRVMMLGDVSTWSSATFGVFIAFVIYYCDASNHIMGDLGDVLTKIPSDVYHILGEVACQCYQAAYDATKLPSLFISAAVYFSTSPRLALETSFSWLYDSTIAGLVLSKDIFVQILDFVATIYNIFPGVATKTIVQFTFISLFNGFVGAKLAVETCNALLFLGGFTRRGIAKFSFASYLQSRYISVVPRSTFTKLQSAGVKGISKKTNFRISLIGATAGILFLSLKWYIFVTICFVVFHMYNFSKKLCRKWFRN